MACTGTICPGTITCYWDHTRYLLIVLVGLVHGTGVATGTWSGNAMGTVKVASLVVGSEPHDIGPELKN